MEPGITLDTGALIAWERQKRKMIAVLKAVHEDDLSVTVPTAVLVEWFRGNPRRFNAILDAVKIEDLTETVARSAGEALVGLPGSITIVDAVVMASAAQRADVVYTSDPHDLEALRKVFPNVKVLEA